MLITPSGMDYQTLEPEDLVLLDLNGQIVEGKYRLLLKLGYTWNLPAAPDINAVAHVHSPYAVALR